MTALPPSLTVSADTHWLGPVLEMAAQAGSDWAFAPSGGLRVATLTPAMDAGCAGAARAFARLTLHRWGIAERADDILTVVSELMTNAWRHALPGAARTSVQLGVMHAGRGLLCAVADPSPRPPVQRELGQLGETGRGLQVIAALSDGWGCTVPVETGKIVWAMFAAVRAW
jgi:anti-sigma regulatory factor (Ser/Thr protein kinase)